MRWTTNTTTMRKRSRRASPPDCSYEAAGRRGLGPRDQEHAPSARLSWLRIKREYTQQQQ